MNDSGRIRSDTLVIHTDGGCDPNPGPGGDGVVLRCSAYRNPLHGGFAGPANQWSAPLRSLTSRVRGGRSVLPPRRS